MRRCRTCEHQDICNIYNTVKEDPSFHCSRHRSEEKKPVFDERKIRLNEREKFIKRWRAKIEARTSGDVFPRQFAICGKEQREGYMRAWREIDTLLNMEGV